MNILILHLTDLHISENTDLNSKIIPLTQAIISEISSAKNIFIVFSGDVAYSGKKGEYEVVTRYIEQIKAILLSRKPDLTIELIIVPGNHDCNFSNNKQIRTITLQNINYETIGIDDSVQEIMLEPQKEFWEFYKQYNPIPIDRLYYKCCYSINEIKVNFHCINTAWMSKLNEDVGSIFFPVKKYPIVVKEENSINFGVWHHPYNWFTPNTSENNKLEFEQFTEIISSTHFIGHEHKQQFVVSSNRKSNTTINLLHGEIFNEDKKAEKSSFQIMTFSLNSIDGELKIYSWNNLIYERNLVKNITFYKEYIKEFSLNSEFVKQITELKIPILLDNKKTISLPDIFVYPDLEPIKKEANKLEHYISSKKLFEYDDSVIIIDGDSQIGKTSLLAMLYINFYNQHKYPILLSGKDLTDTKIEKYLSKCFNGQYSEDVQFERYRQLNKEMRVLLIDDFQDCHFNALTTKDFIEKCQELFGLIIIVFDSSSNILANLNLESKKAIQFYIKPFGYKKRNELVEKYHYLQVNPNTFNERLILIEVKNTFDSVQAILGERLMPAYPIFLLSIIQALNYKPLKQDETSFGYCYQTLLNYALLKAGVKSDEIDSYLNFLTEFAYLYIEKETDELLLKEVEEFYQIYSDKFFVSPIHEIFAVLKAARIIDTSDGSFKFTYNYILYYLSAKKIADMIHTQNGQKIIGELFSKLENERNANILVFITHHSKDVSFIEESLLNTMMLFDNHQPITLAKDDPFYSDIQELAKNIKNDFIESGRTAKEERERQIEVKEKQEIENDNGSDIKDNSKEVNEIIAPFIKAARSIEIIGQIVKNRKGSLEKRHLNNMVTETYTTGFKSVAYFSELLRSILNELKDVLNKNIDSNDTKSEIEKKILTFLQMTSLRLCMGMITKLTYQIGTKELKDIYLDVAKEMNSPIAKLVTFSINSYYGSISVLEVKKLAEEFHDNVVAMQILKSKVRMYVYNRDLDYLMKQKLASASKMTLIAPKVRFK